MRVGIGYDAHRLVPGRKLIIGGADIPHELGLLGHSDADVLTHAVMDALLGAMGLGDIGRHFPDTDARYKGCSSIKLLKTIRCLMKEQGFRAANIDTVVIAQKPKLSAYYGLMKENIADALEMDIRDINIKATTEEGMGFTGTEQGIAAHAIALLENEGIEHNEDI